MPNKGSGKTDYGEPWIDDGGLVSYRLKNGLPSYDIFDASEWGGTTEEGTQLAARIVSCVNACAGLTDEQLKRVRAVNEMYEALKWITSELREARGSGNAGFHYRLRTLEKCELALAFADGLETERGER